MSSQQLGPRPTGLAPSGAPPPGGGMNPDAFSDKANQGPVVVIVSVVCGTIASLVIGLRMFTRLYVIGAVGADDVLMVVSLAWEWIFIAVVITAVHYGLGKHLPAIDAPNHPNEFSHYLQMVWLSQIFYNILLGFIKASVLSLYMRLGDNSLRRIAIGVLAFVGCQTLSNVLVNILECKPVSDTWNSEIPFNEKKCINIGAYYFAQSGLNIATDIVVYTLPIKLVLKLHVPFKQKIAVGVMLCLGLVACVSSIVRITYVPQILEDAADTTWNMSSLTYWSIIETVVAIIAASLPSLKALAKRYLPHLLGSDYSSRSRNTFPSRYGYGERSRKSGVGPFHRLGLGGQQDNQHNPNILGSIHRMPSVRLQDLDPATGQQSLDLGDHRGFGKADAVTTVCEQDAVSNNSEERLHLPGQIVARTQITRHVEGDDSINSAASIDTIGGRDEEVRSHVIAR